MAARFDNRPLPAYTIPHNTAQRKGTDACFWARELPAGARQPKESVPLALERAAIAAGLRPLSRLKWTAFCMQCGPPTRVVPRNGVPSLDRRRGAL